MSQDIRSSRGPATQTGPTSPVSDSPPNAVQTAPRSRRGDYLLTAVIGIFLPPLTLTLTGLASRAAGAGQLPRIILFTVTVFIVSALAQWLFAARSSLGGLIGGAVALLAQAVILARPGHAAAAPFAWARSLIPTGAVLIAAALLLGGSWGMRQARRAGREDARLSSRLSANDRTPGVTPAAPPSRRRDHILSFPLTLLAVGAALVLIANGYARLVTPGAIPSGAMLTALAALALLIPAAALTGRSTLGARATGALLILCALPALLGGVWPNLPGRAALAGLLPDDPTGASLLLTGILLTTAGWGAHLARREGRARELLELRSRETPTPPRGLPHAW
ncbi:hypothetical protein [Actinomyces sp.]|uniref:hypothetical protein n=1 Tax=Actinomyces sp. TaxID=29317 RepID=UPI0026DCBFA1|nr:hypothetical protein [Actinomyces sp.]MDO4900965.1 hypothetical protein [Actinomyces sp.]